VALEEPSVRRACRVDVRLETAPLRGSRLVSGLAIAEADSRKLARDPLFGDLGRDDELETRTTPGKRSGERQRAGHMAEAVRREGEVDRSPPPGPRVRSRAHGRHASASRRS